MNLASLQPEARKRYFNHQKKLWIVKIFPGEFHVCTDQEEISTTLGSCIAACIRDVKLGIGGMNHFMLPHSDSGEWAGASASARYGNYAMEHLINEILKRGGLKKNLEVQLFGAGNVMGTVKAEIPESNALFAKNYLLAEGIHLAKADLGGPFSRRVIFNPRTGLAELKKIEMAHSSAEHIDKKERSYQKFLDKQPIESDIILFNDKKRPTHNE